jgi:hypothetical protein
VSIEREISWIARNPENFSRELLLRVSSAPGQGTTAKITWAGLTVKGKYTDVAILGCFTWNGGMKEIHQGLWCGREGMRQVMDKYQPPGVR